MTVDLDAAIRLLRLLTPLSASLAFVTVAIGLVTGHWLYSEEKMSNPKFNRTGDPELEFISKFTVSGLWTLCYTNPGETDRHCFNIDYFPTEEYSPDPNDSTLSIPYAVLRSTPFFFMATALLVVGEVSCFLGHFAPRRRYCTFLSGVTFILSGLFLLLGLVVYVSVFTAEIGSKLRPSSSLQPALFTYTYGYSFHLVVTGFLAAEVAGTSAIFLFIYWHRNRIAKKEMHRKMTLALVQTPVDLGYTAAHGHQLPLVPPPPPPTHHHHVPINTALSPCLRQPSYRDQQQQQHCGINGFVKIPCSCSAVMTALTSTDDESSIPTPPPAVSMFQRDCPIHYHPEGSSYVTVHSPATGSGPIYPPPTSVPVRHRLHHYHKQTSQEREMPPDITAFSPVLVQQQRRQFSSDSDTSGYKVNSAQRHAERQTTICYQCHGVGHVAVAAPLPVSNESVRQQTPYGSLPREMTSSTVCSAIIDSPEEEEIVHHRHRQQDEADRVSLHSRHQRSHSSGTNYHGSLRRITAV